VNLVVDASVAVKWFLPDPADSSPRSCEPDGDRAAALLRAVQRGEVTLLQPIHWIAEVAAVITRLRPAIAEQTLVLLDALELQVADDLAIYRRASRMAAELGHHLFDTLYHAVALERDHVLVTADDAYARKAAGLGGLVRLAQWEAV
jgi:predicted nucleic acid-binding protein